MKELIGKNITYLTQLTKEEADFILHVLKWDDEQKAAFKIAKQIFDGEWDDDKVEKFNSFDCKQS